MQSKNQKKRNAVFIIGGGIVLAAILLIVIICEAEGAKTGAGQAAYILERIGMESPKAFHWSLVQTAIVALGMLLVFLIVIHQFRKNTKILLEQEQADKEQLREAISQIEREKAAMENIQAALGSGPWSMEFNQDGEIISCIWTDVFRNMLGYQGEADFPNRLDSWSNLLHEEDKEYVMKEYWDTVRDYTGQKTYDVKYRLLTRNAGWRWFHAAGRLSRREDGSPVTFVGFFVDIDDEKKMEAQLEAQREDLQNALAAAQHANRAKTTFLNNMSHDIRTPMNAILGFTVLLAKDADHPDKVREYTRKITTSGQHLLSLINDVLDVSKIESGKVVLSIGEFTLSNMVSSVDAIIRPAAKAKGQKFEVTVTGIKNERLVGDETRINQILINLLSNAVKYTQEGGSIWFRIIGLPQRSSQFEHIRIEVEDNGYGMTPEYLETIFDAFTRAENSTTNKVQGTGLGMAITKNIVELMGGSIHVVSEVEKGSLFTVELELRIPEEQVDRNFWKNHEISRILVVDDDGDICRNVQILMEDTGVLADTALSGEEGIRQVCRAKEQNKPYHVILLDWKMPGMDGIETARRIRAVVEAHVPILFLTAYNWEELQEEAAQAGIDGFLAKPFFVSAFKEKILELHAALEDKGENNESAEQDSLEGCRFLAAEDNEINAEILLQLLELEGAVCEVAEDGQEALERFQNSAPGEFDAILMDVQMPKMNGYEATKAIRGLEREDAASVLIIAMTANAFAEDVKDALDAGMNAHIAKPVDMGLLKKTVRQYIQRRE